MNDKMGITGLFDAGFRHRNLFNDRFDEDIVLQNNFFQAYNPSDFVTVGREDQPIQEKGVRATWYADEKDGTEWHGKLTATETQYNAYAFDVALNKSLHHKFPLGSYIRITRKINDNDGNIIDTRDVIVRVTDVKGGEGIDLSKAAANILGITGTGSVTLELLKPKDSENINPGKSRHPMAKCYPREIKLIWERSRKKFYKRPERNRFKAFNLHSWQIAERLNRFGLNNGIVRPEVYGEHIPGTDHEMRFVTSAGPFSTVDDALDYAARYCSYCETNDCDPDERTAIAAECSGMSLYHRDWTRYAWTSRYKRRNREDNYEIPLAEIAPPVAEINIIDKIENIPDEEDDFDFSQVELTISTEDAADYFHSRLLIDELRKMGSLKQISKTAVAEKYIMTDFNIDRADIYFRIADELAKEHEELDFFFITTE